MGIFDVFKKKTGEDALEDSTKAGTSELLGTEETVHGESTKEGKASSDNSGEQANGGNGAKLDTDLSKEGLKYTKTPENQSMQMVVNDGRRFTLLVENSFQLEDNNGIVVVGNLHGEIKVDDSVYIMHPNGQVTVTKINGIEIDNGVAAEEAKNQHVGLKLSEIKDKSLVQKYSVLTSIRPQHVINVNQPVENGQLMGLTMEFPHYHKDNEFMSLFVYVVCHAHFISPVYMNKEPKSNGDGTATFTEGSTFSFLSLTPPGDKEKKHLPVFTDGTALKKWEGLYQEENPPKNMILRFPDVVSVSSKNMDGVVINPFGPVPVVLTKDYIDKITSLEGYKTEFVNKEKQNAQQVKVEKDTKFILGVPAENEEVKQIREAIIAAVVPMANVVKVYFLAKMDSNQEKTYFLVVDCDKDTEMETFNTIGAATKPYLKQTKYMEMISYEQFGNRINNMKGHGLIFDRATFWK